MTAVAMFPFEFDGHLVRVVLRDDRPWFALADVSAVLGLGRPQSVAHRLPESERRYVYGRSPSPEGVQEWKLAAISRTGLMLLVAMATDVRARRFQRWVSRAVLPCIRGDAEPVARAVPEAMRAVRVTAPAEKPAAPVPAPAQAATDVQGVAARLRKAGFAHMVEDLLGAMDDMERRLAALEQARSAPVAVVKGRRMDVDPVQWAWEQNVHGSRKTVLVALAEAIKTHGSCRMSVERLGKVCGLADRTVARALSDLRGLGLVGCHGSAGAAPLYRLVM